MKIVRTRSTKKVDSNRIAQVEIYEGDLSENQIWTLPNIESMPLAGQQVLLSKTDKRGEDAAMFVPLETDISEGETRLKATDADGIEELEFYMKHGGILRVANSSDELILVLSDLIDELINALVVTGIGSQPFAPQTIAALTNVKTRLDTFKE